MTILCYILVYKECVMAISFQNNPFSFNNPFANNAFNHLKPQIHQNRESSAKELESNSNKVSKNLESNATQEVKNPIDALKTNLTNKVLGGILNFGLQNAKNNLTNLQNLRTLPNEMKPKEEQNLAPEFKNPIDTLEKAITNTPQKVSDPSILDKLTFLNGEKVRGGNHNSSDIYISYANNLAVQESITYTISYDNATGQYAQSLSYSSSLVANFEYEITDKNGNTFLSQTQLVLGKNLETQITGGVGSVNETLKSFLGGQNFALEYDGELDEDSFKSSGLDRMLLVMDSTNNAISNAFNEILGGIGDFGHIYGRSDKDIAEIFKTLQSAIDSSLEVFLGIKKNPNTTSNNTEYLRTKDYSFDMTTTNTNAQTSEQWEAQKIEFSRLEVAYATLGFNGANPFALNA